MIGRLVPLSYGMKLFLVGLKTDFLCTVLLQDRSGKLLLGHTSIAAALANLPPAQAWAEASRAVRAESGTIAALGGAGSRAASMPTSNAAAIGSYEVESCLTQMVLVLLSRSSTARQREFAAELVTQLIRLAEALNKAPLPLATATAAPGTAAAVAHGVLVRGDPAGVTSPKCGRSSISAVGPGLRADTANIAFGEDSRGPDMVGVMAEVAEQNGLIASSHTRLPKSSDSKSSAAGSDGNGLAPPPPPPYSAARDRSEVQGGKARRSFGGALAASRMRREIGTGPAKATANNQSMASGEREQAAPTVGLETASGPVGPVMTGGGVGPGGSMLGGSGGNPLGTAAAIQVAAALRLGLLLPLLPVVRADRASDPKRNLRLLLAGALPLLLSSPYMRPRTFVDAIEGPWIVNGCLLPPACLELQDPSSVVSGDSADTCGFATSASDACMAIGVPLWELLQQVSVALMAAEWPMWLRGKGQRLREVGVWGGAGAIRREVELWHGGRQLPSRWGVRIMGAIPTSGCHMVWPPSGSAVGGTLTNGYSQQSEQYPNSTFTSAAGLRAADGWNAAYGLGASDLPSAANVLQNQYHQLPWSAWVPLLWLTEGNRAFAVGAPAGATACRLPGMPKCW